MGNVYETPLEKTVLLAQVCFFDKSPNLPLMFVAISYSLHFVTSNMKTYSCIKYVFHVISLQLYRSCRVKLAFYRVIWDRVVVIEVSVEHSVTCTNKQKLCSQIFQLRSL